jgi:colanic acid/amylovoran biosynthesis glycosyltransferase
MVASLREKKGHRFGIDAFSAVAQSRDDVYLTIVGGGPLRKPLEAQVCELGLQDRVTFRGSLPRTECQVLLQQAHVLLYPSITASNGDTEGGAPVAILEAMAAGLPVISTRHADIPFVLRDGASGILVDEGDVDGMVGALRQVLDGGEEVDRRASEGRRTVEEGHTLESQGKLLEAIYDEAGGASPLRHGASPMMGPVA